MLQQWQQAWCGVSDTDAEGGFGREVTCRMPRSFFVASTAEVSQH